MKPQKGPELRRTQNDTDRISLLCKIVTDAGSTVVSDAHTVTLHVRTSPATVITGTPKGDASGTFLFDPATIKHLVGKFDCEVQVDDGDYVQTIGEFRLNQRAEIG